ncbi:MAG: hypothetical protein KF787_04860 [Phycisphaeraceae bacterium]|nr:hypothetical protein [Phycisphaerae bacterium]MBX3391960.1 hypothetical protein [Phycisphaeraceae bacterium]HRJ49894.1 hypothetical protein [Phycisphaerales bacterium]
MITSDELVPFLAFGAGTLPIASAVCPAGIRFAEDPDPDPAADDLGSELIGRPCPGERSEYAVESAYDDEDDDEDPEDEGFSEDEFEDDEEFEDDDEDFLEDDEEDAEEEADTDSGDESDEDDDF